MAFGFRHYQCLRTTTSDGLITLHLQQVCQHDRCSHCYSAAVRDHLPKAIHVFDHFHVVNLFNERRSDFRREQQRDAEGLGKTILKGTRWLILKNPENLDDEKGERTRLDDALRLNLLLATAYYMKDEFRYFWEIKTLAEARRFLDDWCRRAEASGGPC